MKRFLFASSAALVLVFGLGSSTSWAKPADLPSQNQIECPDGSDDPVQPPRVSVEVDFDLLSRRLTVKVGVAQPAAPMNLDTVCPAVVAAFVEQFVKQIKDTLAATGKRIEADTVERADKSRPLEVRLFDPIKVRIEQVPFKQAIKNLAHASGLPIVIDYKALRLVNINVDTPVTLKVESVSAHKALSQFLESLDLAYVIQDGVVLVTMRENSTGGPSDAVRRARANDKLAQRLFDAGERCRLDGEYSQARTCYQQVHLLTPTTIFGRVAIARITEIEERMRVDAEEQSIPRSSEDPEEMFQSMRNRTVPLGLVQVSY